MNRTPSRPAYRLVRRLLDTAGHRLDPSQRAVVDHVDGPLLVTGGPGTGKTTALVESVLARVAQGTDPRQVLVLTFSRRGAARLRDRIAARLGAGAHRELSVRTFHGYAFALLRAVAAAHGEPPPRLLNGPEQDLVIRELLAADSGDGAEGAGSRDGCARDPVASSVDASRPGGFVGWPVELRPALRTRGFAAELRDLLLRAAERDVPPDRLAALGRQWGRPDWVAAARFAQQYADVLALRDATTRGPVGYDTAELIRAATSQLAADPRAHADAHARARYVYVDELHDVDPAQWRLLELVAGGGRHLVGFADHDSSMFAFRGADPSAVLGFGERFRTVAGDPAPTVPLPTCWRSGPVLVAAAGRVASRLRGPARHRQRTPVPGRADPTTQAPGGEVEVRLFRSQTQEAAHLAHQLRAAHLLDGVPWSAMAVLMRTSGQLAGLRRALVHAGVPVRVAADDLPLAAQPAVAPLLLVLRCALDPDRLDEEAAVALLHSSLGGADPFAERRLRQGLRGLAVAAGDRRPSGVLLADAVADPTELAAVEHRWAEPARRVARLLAVAREAVSAPGATAEQVLWAIWEASGLAERWSAASAAGGHRGTAADRDLDAVLALFDAAARFSDRLPGAGPEVFADHVVGQQIPADSLAPAADQGDAVRLLTVHSAKGLEWDLVAVPGVQEGRWPDLRLRGSVLGSELLVDAVAGRAVPGDRTGLVAAALDSERRLFHVAVSRARRRLIVSAVAAGDGEEQPSRFLDELQAGGVVGVDPDGYDEDELTGGPEVSTGATALAVPESTRRPDDLPRPLTLPALVAQLRTVVADRDVVMPRRRAAARQLARLAAAKVPGAHPDEWWGLRTLSDPGPVVGPDEILKVSPSVVEQVQRCGLRWLLERHGGSSPPGPEQTIGNLVHAAAERADSLTAPELYRYLDDHWGVVEVAARWEQGRKQDQARQMVDRLVRWLAANPRTLVATEQPFQVRLPDTGPDHGPDPNGGPGIEIVGTVDRVERDADGRLVVIDFKTGKTIPKHDDVARHPQLGTYQLAVALGGFARFGVDPSAEALADPAPAADQAPVADSASDTVPGGAVLVQLGRDRRDGPEQRQQPLGAAEDPRWAEQTVRSVASEMSAARFTARANSYCMVCAVRTSCPLSEQGRQMVEPTDPKPDATDGATAEPDRESGR